MSFTPPKYFRASGGNTSSASLRGWAVPAMVGTPPRCAKAKAHKMLCQVENQRVSYPIFKGLGLAVPAIQIRTNESSSHRTTLPCAPRGDRSCNLFSGDGVAQSLNRASAINSRAGQMVIPWALSFRPRSVADGCGPCAPSASRFPNANAAVATATMVITNGKTGHRCAHKPRAGLRRWRRRTTRRARLQAAASLFSGHTQFRMPSCDSALGACSRWASSPPDKRPQPSRAPAQGQEPHRLPMFSPRLAVPVLARPSQWDLSPWTGRAPGPGA